MKNETEEENNHYKTILGAYYGVMLMDEYPLKAYILKNIENFNQRLYINEGGIGDEITQRLKSLQTANEMEENLFDLPTEVDLDEYDNAGFAEDEADDFKVEADDE